MELASRDSVWMVDSNVSKQAALTDDWALNKVWLSRLMSVRMTDRSAANGLVPEKCACVCMRGINHIGTWTN